MQQPDAIPDAYPFARPDAMNIQMLGACRIIHDGRICEPSNWRLRKAAQLVKQLALAPGRQLHRDQIFENLWPELDPDATSNLRVTLHFARKLLTQDGFDGAVAIQSRGQLLALFPDHVVWTDIEAFEAAAHSARQANDPAVHQAALDLYVGDLLPEERFEDWVSDRRESLRSTRIELLIEMADHLERRGDIDRAIGTLRDVIDSDPVNEYAHAALMQVYARAGRRVQALRQYQRLQEALRDALDTEPDPEVTRLYEALLTNADVPATLPERYETAGQAIQPAPGSPGSQPPARTNLPVQLTSFVGRQDALPAVRDAIERSRLVTLTGPAGAGKTRLTIEAAKGLRGNFPDGIWFVDLSTLSDSSLVAPAIATTLAVSDVHGRAPLETLAITLEGRHALLVLDNCEHLIDACVGVASTLLKRCPRLRIVATSREPLRIDGEAVWPVPPLEIPALEQSTSPRALRDVDATRLFVARARAVTPTFTLTADNSAAVADICRKLEGMPLAIELAATRVRGATVEEIARRIENALGLLAGGNRDRPARQQSLRAAIEWSYDLLPPDERRLFERLSVFAGSVSLEAVEAVCMLPDDGARDALDLLFALLDKSLLVVEEHGDQTRYRMLETIRQYAAERLERAGETGLMADRRRDWHLALAERAEQGLIGPAVYAWMRQLAPEIDSIRLVLQRSSREGDHDTVLRLASHLWAFWLISGRMSEGRTWIEPLLSGPKHDTISVQTRTRALAAAGLLAQRQGDYRQAVIWTDESLSLARDGDDRLSMAYAVTNLCLCALYRGDIERAIALAHEGLELSRQIGMLAGVPTCLSSLGLAEHWRGNDAVAADYLRQSIAAAREIGFDAFASWLLGQLAEIERVRGDVAAARAHAHESIALGQAVGDEYGPALGRRALGHQAADAGDLARATTLIASSLSVFHVLGYKLRSIECLEDLGELASRGPRAVDAVQLLSAAEQLRAAEDSPPARLRQAALERALDQIRPQLTADAYATAQSSGRAMTLDQAVECALARTT